MTLRRAARNAKRRSFSRLFSRTYAVAIGGEWKSVRSVTILIGGSVDSRMSTTWLSRRNGIT
ncbi:hypothetical protein [Amycolatopsis taiwanensis]|uniref:hypothetical protein n=1 Tax=Amycolatopsis taiwanensis TaxID=342230 RepID=UPI002554FEF6|nr:hypothetical protein [Amycolatopsis taiwanensis]